MNQELDRLANQLLPYILRKIRQASGTQVGAITPTITDAQIFQAVLSQDGAGSGLDADTVDGYQAATLLDHGEHTGLADDDHTQYLLADGSRALSSATATRLLATDADKKPVSVANLASWIAGTTNQVTVTDDSDGTVTLSLPTNIAITGDVYADNTSTAAQALNARVEAISGDKATAALYYNPIQVIVPSTWALGADDGTGRDDFLRLNYGAGSGQWSDVTDCAPQRVSIAAAPSQIQIRSKATSDSSPAHGIIQCALSGHTASDYYWARMAVSAARSEDHRCGYVLMDADLLRGAAIWHVFSVATKTFALSFATYNSANAWLSQANAKTSNVGYATDWTTRYTGASTEMQNSSMQIAAIRIESTATALWVRTADSVALFEALRTTALSFTPAYQFLFVEGNLGARKLGYWDFTGRNILTV